MMDDIREILGVVPVEKKLVQHCLKCFGYIKQSPLEAPICSRVISRIGNGKGGRGIPNLTCKKYVNTD
jgi:hypothetical protein